VNTMRAMAVESFGGPEELHAVRLPVPQPGPGEIRVRVAAVAVNPTDIMLREGAHVSHLGSSPFPYVPGMDFAGTVDALGDDCSGRLHLDDHVMGISNPLSRLGGSYADYVIVSEAAAVTVPAGADLFAATTILMNGLTARLAVDAITPGPDRVLAVTGSAGAVGGFAVQLAIDDGWDVIADAPQLAADRLVTVARGPGFVTSILDRVPAGVDGVIDGALLGSPILPAIRDGGAVIVLRDVDIVSERGIRITRVRVSGAAEQTDRLELLRDQFAGGILTARIADVLPAERAGEAHARLAAGSVRGRIVLDFT
jgi:NADPH2:quinone reductase